MLRSFRLGNHRSFAEEQELLLMPADHDSDRPVVPVVPVAAIYGANASGKSNLLAGLSFMRRAVLQSFARWDVEGTIPREPFRLTPEWQTKPSVLVAEFVADDTPYTYGFSLSDTAVEEEWLYSYPERRKRIIFERKPKEIRFGSTIHDMKAKLEVLEELTRPNALFLSAGARLNLGPLMPAYRWFESGIHIQPPPGSFSPGYSTAIRVARFLSREEGNHRRLTALLAAADTGITDIQIGERQDSRHSSQISDLELQIAELDNLRDDDARNPRQRALLERQLQRAVDRRLELKFVHGDEETPFDLSDESTGTRNWLDLLPVVLDTLDAGRVLVIDEIDASLHPMLTARLIELFGDQETNPHGAQLIFTTHDTSLLGTMLGGQVLERDQIWFVEKDHDGASRLYPLTDFKPRKEQNTERRYLAGSYGAVPVLDPGDFADAVLDRR